MNPQTINTDNHPLGANFYYNCAPFTVPDPLAAIKAAHKAGKTVQFQTDSGIWEDIAEPSWFLADTYRIKPESRNVPLEALDVMPGSVGTFYRHDATSKPEHFSLTVAMKGVWFINPSTCEVEFRSWKHFQYDCSINRSIPLTGRWDATAWEKCEKEEK